MSNLEKFFHGDLAKLALSDLEELLDHKAKLHGAPPASDVAEPDLGGLGPPGAGARPEPTLASLGVHHLKLMKHIADADSQQRPNMLLTNRLELFSIVFAGYRPAPAYLSGHEMPEGAFSEKVSVGGITWRQVIQPDNQTNYLPNLATVARQCCRLDKQTGRQAGSGFRIEDGNLLTNRHVIKEPGWLYGDPPNAAVHPASVLYNQVNTTPRRHGDGIMSSNFRLFTEPTFDVAVVFQSEDWMQKLGQLSEEFLSLPPLVLQTEQPDDLAGRLVAVIGHPFMGNAGGPDADVTQVFADGLLGDKRLMPGTINADQPLVFENGQWLINHDCSTLGGASGSCLVDLKTGVVLGIHRAGDASLGNRAVPAWSVLEKLAMAGGLA